MPLFYRVQNASACTHEIRMRRSTLRMFFFTKPKQDLPRASCDPTLNWCSRRLNITLWSSILRKRGKEISKILSKFIILKIFQEFWNIFQNFWNNFEKFWKILKIFHLFLSSSFTCIVINMTFRPKNSAQAQEKYYTTRV